MARNPKMDIQRKNVGRKKAIRWIIAIVIISGVSYRDHRCAGQTQAGGAGVPMSTLWPGTVRRGPMVLEVSGIGTLVPEDTMVIPAQTAGRIERISFSPATPYVRIR